MCLCVCHHRFTGHQLTTAHPAGLIQEVQNPQLALNEVDARLVVIEVDEGPLNVLTDILSLLQLEDMLSEERGERRDMVSQFTFICNHLLFVKLCSH